MWFAILLTVAASAGNNIGKVMQKEATLVLPRLTFRKEVLSQYLGSSTWLLGLAADLAGGVLMVQAFSMAPVSVVQPVSSVGLAFLMIASHYHLKERLSRRELAAAGVAALGILCLGCSSDDAPPQALAPPPGRPTDSAAAAAAGGGGAEGLPPLHPPSDAAGDGGGGGGAGVALGAVGGGPTPLRVFVGFVLLAAALGAEVYLRHRRPLPRPPPHHHHLPRVAPQPGIGGGGGANGGGGGGGGASHKAVNAGGAATTPGSGGGGGGASADAAACALEAGACFGLSAAACRTGFLLAPVLGWVMVPLGLVGSVTLTSGGMVLQTRGLKGGSAMVVCTLAANAAMVTGVVAGLVALGEQLPVSRLLLVLRLSGWALLAAATALLLPPPGGGAAPAAAATRAAAAAQWGLALAAAWLPLAVRRQLPRAAQRALLRAGGAGGGGGGGGVADAAPLLAVAGEAAGGGGAGGAPLLVNVHAQ